MGWSQNVTEEGLGGNDLSRASHHALDEKQTADAFGRRIISAARLLLLVRQSRGSRRAGADHRIFVHNGHRRLDNCKFAATHFLLFLVTKTNPNGAAVQTL